MERAVPQLLIATTNRHKASEIRALLPTAWEVLDLRAITSTSPPEETGATLIENALIKAVAASRLSLALTLADDSGLEVDALGGAPGVRSARYAGDFADDAANRARLLRELAARRPPASTAPIAARFRCAIALARQGIALATVEGVVEGTIIDRERGINGFGYDSLFVPRGYSATFAELSASEKNKISHRGIALRRIAEVLRAQA
jgi:XTP/dITP diphosphohydrolase